jgi:hypothetical protein
MESNDIVSKTDDLASKLMNASKSFFVKDQSLNDVQDINVKALDPNTLILGSTINSLNANELTVS